MGKRIAALAAEPSNYAFISIPLPVLHDPAVSRGEAAIFGAFYSRSRINVHGGTNPRVQLSLRQLAVLGATDRRSAARARDHLVELGYLERVRAGRTTAMQRGVDAFVPRLPEAARDERFLLAGLRGVELDDDEGGGADTHRGVGLTPTGGGADTHGGVGDAPTLRDPRDLKEDPVGDDRATTPSCVPEVATDEPNDPVEEIGTEVETPNLDDGSVHAAACIETAKEERRRRRPRVKSVAPLTPDDELLREPSRRPEFNAWREKTPLGLRWIARDLVGYFVCRYRELRGEEPKEFFATSARIFSHHGSNVSKFVKRWLGGDYRRAIVVVDKILGRAEGLGMPVRLGYFFTPANEGTVLRLDDKVRGRPETPAARNDRAGADTPENQARIAKLREEFIAEEKARNG